MKVFLHLQAGEQSNSPFSKLKILINSLLFPMTTIPIQVYFVLEKTAEIYKLFYLNKKQKLNLLFCFDIAEFIIKTEMVVQWKIEKNKNTNLNP